MTIKKIIISVIFISALGFLSFKSSSTDSSSKVALVSLLNGKGENEGFIITYGDGKIEKRPANVKLIGVDNWVTIQSKAAVVVNEMKEKGYRYVGSHTMITAFMIFEKD